MKATRTMQTLRLFILLLLLYIRSSFPLGLKFVRPSRPLHSLKIRGSSKAYTLANSTAIDAAKAVNAPPPSTRAPRMVWKGAWEFGKRAMKVLHKPYLTSGYVPTDNNVNLSVLYWKSLDGDEYARDLLPGRLGRIFTSRAVRWMYPRLHHANVGIRTRFIDQCLDRVIVEEGETGLNVLILGAGFDSRGVRLLKEGDTRVVELDLEKVIKEKEQVYARNYQRRQRGGGYRKVPKLKPIDLNDLSLTRDILAGEIEEGNKLGLTTVIICEAVLIYVDDCRGVIRAVAEAVRDASFFASNSKMHFVFADRFPVTYGNIDEVERMFMEESWKGRWDRTRSEATS